MKQIKNSGISLLVLVITIIVVIILAGSVILSLSKNNPIDNAKRASYLNDLDKFKSDLSMYETSKISSSLGDFNPTLLQADETSVTYAGVISTDKTISDLIESLKSNIKYIGQLEIVDGEINVKTNDSKKKDWAISAGYKVLITGEPKVTIGLPVPSIVVPGTSVVYTLTLSSTETLNSINLTDKVFVTDSSNLELSTQPSIIVGTLSGTSSDQVRQVNITVSTNTLTEGTYKLKLKSGAITTSNNISNTQDSISLVGFTVDNTAPENPEIIANPATPTNGNVLVTITYSSDTEIKEYSINGTIWLNYIEPITVSTNNTTIYARAKDNIGNQSGQSTLTVANIDKDSPTVSYETNGSTNVKEASTKVTVSDTGGSGINTSLLQCVWDTQNITTPSSGWDTFTNGSTLTKANVTGVYYLWILAEDKAGNNLVSKTNAFTMDNTTPINPTLSPSTTAWTNGNVTVTILYPEDATTKQYSTDGNIWYTYTSPVAVSENNITVYARAIDSAGNQSSQTTLTISNIEKIIPTVAFGTNGASNIQIASTTVTVSDTGGSGLSTSSLKYVWDTQNTTTPSNGWTTFTNGSTITKSSVTSTYYLWIKGNDVAGNSVVIKSNAFTIDNTAPTNPTLSSSITTWTNNDVVVTIIYPVDAATKQYSTNGSTWYNYTAPVVVSENNTTVYAKAIDVAGNPSGQSTLTVSNIDKILPTVTFETNGGTNPTSVSTVVTVNDAGGSGLSTSSLQYVWDMQNTTTPSSGWTIFTNGNTLTKTAEGIYYLWIKAIDNAGNILITKSNIFAIGDVAIPVSTIQTVNKTFSGATSGFSYNNPVIPAGFVAADTSDAKWSNLSTDWDKGLVIQDASGNQFVWVPVDGANVAYAKWCTTEISYASTTDDTLPSGFSTNSITTTYKGFYIARYESMYDYNGGSIRAASKKSTNKTTYDWSTSRNSTYNGYLWNWIHYIDSKSYAENMDTSYGYDTTKVRTNLITGAEWDTVMKWIQNSGKTVTNSRTWGNHSDSTSPANVSGYASLQISGYSNNWKSKNIYDLAGNMWEWTNEIYSSSRVYRGGNFYNSGSSYPASARYYYDATTVSHTIGFRIGIYVL